MSEIDDEAPQLSAETFAALLEFYSEESQKEERINSSVQSLDENWQLSQFWYDEKTVDVLVNATLKAVGPGAKIALVSCPTLYLEMKEKGGDGIEVTLLEYDNRFATYGCDFIHYNYKSPLDVPRNLSGYYDVVIADPPFLSEECLTKTAVTIRFLAKNKIVVCTGEVMADLVNRLLNVQKTSFRPGHVNNLANEFCCYTNFDFDSSIV